MNRLDALLKNPLPSKNRSYTGIFEGFDSDYGLSDNYGNSDMGFADEDCYGDKYNLGTSAFEEDDDETDLGTVHGDDDMYDEVNDLNDVDDDGIANAYDDDLDDDEFTDLDDLSDLTDEELDQLDASLDDDSLDDLIDDDEEDIELEPDESERADDILAVAGTTQLLNDTLSTEEKAELVESPRECGILVDEGLLFESDIRELKEAFREDAPMTEAMYNGPTKLKWSIATVKARLYGTAIFSCAAARNDKDLVKYRKLRKMARVYKLRLQRKYKTAAKAKMRLMFKRLKASKSSTANKVAARIHA